RMPRELDGVRDGALARAGHHFLGGQAFINQKVKQLALFIDRQGIGFGIGAEYGKADVLLDQRPAVFEETRAGNRIVRVERCEYGRQDTAHFRVNHKASTGRFFYSMNCKSIARARYKLKWLSLV